MHQAEQIIRDMISITEFFGACLTPDEINCLASFYTLTIDDVKDIELKAATCYGGIWMQYVKEER